MSVPFRERNPVVIGAASIAVLIVLLLMAFNANKLPLIGGGTTYHADFTEAGGLKTGDEVRIAGVRVGKVTGIELAGNTVHVDFDIQDNPGFGTLTAAQIKVKTILGSMFLALVPAGPGQLASGATIPVDRTQSPYNVVDVFSGLASRSERINIDQLRNSIDVMASLTQNTPAGFRSTLKGLSALSANVAARDAQLNQLLGNTKVVAGILAQRSGDIVGLMKDSNVLFNAVVARRQAIHNLLVATTQMSTQLTQLVNGSKADIKPALAQLEGVTNLLLKNQANIDESLRVMAPFYRVLTNALGTGPWWDTWIANMPPVPSAGG